MVNKLSTLEKLKPQTFEEKKRQIKQNIVINNIEKALNAKISVEKKITINEAETIQNWILEENEKKPHMIEKTIEEIKHEINSGLGLILKTDKILAGSMSMLEITLANNKKMYEAGSLIVNPKEKYRGKGLGKLLCHDIFDHNKDKAVYSITEVPFVIRIYENDLKLHQFTKFEVHPEILAKIEGVGPLLETDIIYGNNEFEKLNESLNNLNFTGGFNNL